MVKEGTNKRERDRADGGQSENQCVWAVSGRGYKGGGGVGRERQGWGQEIWMLKGRKKQMSHRGSEGCESLGAPVKKKICAKVYHETITQV